MNQTRCIKVKTKDKKIINVDYINVFSQLGSKGIKVSNVEFTSVPGRSVAEINLKLEIINSWFQYCDPTDHMIGKSGNFSEKFIDFLTEFSKDPRLENLSIEYLLMLMQS